MLAKWIGAPLFNHHLLYPMLACKDLFWKKLASHPIFRDRTGRELKVQTRLLLMKLLSFSCNRDLGATPPSSTYTPLQNVCLIMDVFSSGITYGRLAIGAIEPQNICRVLEELPVCYRELLPEIAHRDERLLQALPIDCATRPEVCCLSNGKTHN